MPTQEFYDEMAKRHKKIKEEQGKTKEFLATIASDESMLPTPLPEGTRPNVKLQKKVEELQSEGKLRASTDILESLELSTPISEESEK